MPADNSGDDPRIQKWLGLLLLGLAVVGLEPLRQRHHFGPLHGIFLYREYQIADDILAAFLGTLVLVTAAPRLPVLFISLVVLAIFAFLLPIYYSGMTGRNLSDFGSRLSSVLLLIGASLLSGRALAGLSTRDGFRELFWGKAGAWTALAGMALSFGWEVTGGYQGFGNGLRRSAGLEVAASLLHVSARVLLAWCAVDALRKRDAVGSLGFLRRMQLWGVFLVLANLTLAIKGRFGDNPAAAAALWHVSTGVVMTWATAFVVRSRLHSAPVITAE